MGRRHLLEEADPLAGEEHADQAGDAGIDVDDGAAGEIERAPAEDQAVRRPDHMRDRRVDDGQPERGEEQDRAELHPLGQRADDQRGGDRREGHLEGDEDQFGNADAGGEGRRERCRR